MSEPATVTTAAPLTIRYDSGTLDLPAGHAASYTPVVDDRVLVDSVGARIVVICKVIW